MSLDFNVSPFFDDYSEDKKFYRILFRPGYAVQARELTQLQTILQQQIKRHGDHIFKQGSMVIPGQISYDTDVYYVKINDYNGLDTYLNNILNKEIKNSVGLVAEVLAYTLTEDDDSPTLFVKYKNSVIDQNTGNNISEFEVLETLTAVDTSILGSVTIADTAFPVGKATTATVKKGVYYINNNFVLVDDQTIVLDKYSQSPSCKVGLQLEETIVYPEEDPSLLDNALGSPNYAAPGAARYYMDLKLIKIALTSEDPDNFIELLRLSAGKVIFKIDRSQYAELEKTLARRTYDESGDYALSPFNIRARHYRDNNRNEWAAGEKYIQGDVIRTQINNSVNYFYFTCTVSGISGTTKPVFATDPLLGYVEDGSDIRWEYSAIPRLNQGVYSFPSGDTAYSNFTLNDHIRLDGMLAYGVEAGKAYVRGYEIEKLATDYLPAEKSRSLPAGSSALATYLGSEVYDKNELNGLDAVTAPLSSVKTQNIDTSMGSYVLVKNTNYAPDISGLTQVNLYSDVITNTTTNTIIGTARIRAMEYHDTITGPIRLYKLFLFDIRMNTGKGANLVRAIGAGLNGTNFRCDAYIANALIGMVINDPLNTSLVYPLADYAISNIESMDYTVVAPFTQSAAAGSLTLNAPSGYTFESGSVVNNYVIINNTSAGAVVTNATFGTAGGASMTISNLTGTNNYTVFATLKRSNATNPHSTVVVTDSIYNLTLEAQIQAPEIVLDKAYITRIVSIRMASAYGAQSVFGTDITNRYVFKSNASSTMIRKASIVLQDGAPPPTGSIQIKYEYLAITSASAGNVLNMKSYTHANSAMRYEDIQTVNGIQLRDAIDFRPVESVSNFTTRYFPKFGTTTSVQYRNYLSRIDNVSLTSTGKLIVTKGIPSSSPFEQSIPADSMKLARITLEPYTFDTDSGSVAIERVENKRYTMRDIGKLERRIEDLEYYTSLSLLEMDTKNLRVVDSAGNERFQNGFIVDRFDGQGVGNAASSDWNASIDSDKGELRPFFSQRQTELLENADKPIKDYIVNGDLVTFPFTQVSLIEQPRASRREFVNPYALYTYIGLLTLTPWADTWFSTERRPDVILNDEGQYNAVVSMAEEQGVLGTVWNSWQKMFSSRKSLAERESVIDRWSKANTVIMNDSNNGGTFWRARSSFTSDELAAIGVDPSLAGQANRLGSNVNFAAGLRVLTIETEAVETTSRRTGVRSFIVDKVDSRVLEDRVVETKVVPYIRPRTVLLRGFGFRSNTRMYGFFDGVNVDRYVECATRIQYTPITGSHDKFTTTKNCGSNVQNAERLVSNAIGVYITGTITINNGSKNVVGSTTAFLSEIAVGDTVFFSENDRGYIVETVTDNTHLTIKDNYAGTSTTNTAMSVLSKKFSNSTVEMAFAHGEVVKEYTAAGAPTGRSFVVVGQEVNAGLYYMWVLNEKGDKVYNTTGHYLQGEYTDYNGTKPKVTFVARTTFSTLQTSATGQINGIFRIPNNPIDKFRTGTREFKLTDSPSNSVATETTHGEAFYEANGLIEVKQRTIVSTRTAEIASEVVSDQRTIVNTNDRIVDDSGWFDPLAQTFLVQNDGGCFITSVDLYFATVDPTGKIPVRVEIREVVNGYPGKYVLPFSRVEKKPSEIAVDSLRGTVATNFKFQSPVYLQDGVEYALVVLSDSNAYEVWISQTLEKDVISGTVINSQPYSGVFFKSQNASTWTADQTQDMKFKIYRANFTKSSAEVQFIAPSIKPRSLETNPFNFIENGTQFRVSHRDHGFRSSGDTVTYTTRQIVTFVNGIPAPYIFNTPLAVSNAETDMYMVEMSGVLPRSTSTLTPSTGSKTFTMGAGFDSTKFAAFRAGSTRIRFTAYNSDYNTVYANSYMEGTITSVSATQIVLNVDKVGTDTSTSRSLWILSSTSSGKVGGSYITATENYDYQTAMITANTNIIPGTAISFSLAAITKADQSIELVRDIELKENFDLNEEMVLPSNENYDDLNTSGFPILVTARLTTNNSSLSPSIDLHGVAMTLVNNKIDNPTVAVNDGSLDYVMLGDNVDLSDSPNVTLEAGTTDTSRVVKVAAGSALAQELNKLKLGNVTMFEYTGVTDNYYQVLIDKYNDGSFLYLEFEPEYDPVTLTKSASLVDTVLVDIYWMTHYVNEIAPYGGTTVSKYLSKKINFSRPSDMVQIMFAALIPNEAEVDVYYKTGLNATGNFDVLPYKKAEPTSGYVKNDSEKRDMTFKVEGLDLYDTIVVKLVMRSANAAKIPRISDLRIISCAA